MLIYDDWAVCEGLFERSFLKIVLKDEMIMKTSFLNLSRQNTVKEEIIYI